MSKKSHKSHKEDILSDSLCLEWKNLNYYVPATEENNYSFWQSCRIIPENHILKDVNGQINTGDLVAILGCSGAGKTTLLAAISQRLRGNLTGDIVLNGVAINRGDMTRISSFLPQFEINVKTFTAFEHLYFMSHFKMHRRTTKSQKLERVNDLLLACGLRDAMNTRIQQLSGGERKRLSLAEELITDPPFLFCDEPTTGLDSYSAYTVMKTLRHLCTRQRVMKTSLTSLYGEDSFSSPSSSSDTSLEHTIEMQMLCEKENYDLMDSINDLPTLSLFNTSPNGRHKKAVICSIHQPTSDIFELFTHVILMDAGRIIFQGTTERAHNFFTELGYRVPHNCNPADYYLKTISDSHTSHTDGALIKAKFDLRSSGTLYTGSWLTRKNYEGDHPASITDFKKILWIEQVYLLWMRFITEDSRNIRSAVATWIFMITSVTLAIMYSGVNTLTQTSIQDITGSIFMLSNEMIFTFSYGVTFVFPQSLPIVRREVGEGIYSLSAYYMAVVLSFLPTSFFKSYLFFAIVYTFIYSSRGFMLYWTMGLVLSLSTFAATAYGLFLSSFFESDRMATECAAPFDLLFLIFGGAYYNVDSIPFLKYFSIFFYSNEALMYNFWIDVENITCPANTEHPCIQSGVEVLERASYHTNDYTFWVDSAALVGVAAVFNLMAYSLIRKFIKRSGYY